MFPKFGCQFGLRRTIVIPILPGFLTLSSRGPGHRPFTAATRVRIPLGTPLLGALGATPSQRSSLDLHCVQLAGLRADRVESRWGRQLAGRRGETRGESQGLTRASLPFRPLVSPRLYALGFAPVALAAAGLNAVAFLFLLRLRRLTAGSV